MDTLSMGCKKMILETNPHNPRTISKDAYEKLKASIERNPDGLTANKIAYKDGIIISGNQRYRALTELGLEHKKEWFKDLSGWTPEQIDEWIIQSNISAGEWDWDILANEWEQTDLEEWGVDTSQEWDNKKDLPEDIDDIPEVKTPVSKLGDLWLLDGHRVLCGDSTDKATVEKLMAGKKADMVFTDPPYGMNYSGRGKETSNKILGDNIDPTIFYNIGSEISERYVWGRIENYVHLENKPRDTIIWKKNNFGMGSGYRGQYECCFYFGDFKGSDSDVWEIPKDTNYEHPTQKPVALCIRAIKNSNPKLIIDYFLGSGSTLIACEQTERLCYGLELDPLYVDVICKRWQTLTGQMPILESTGETHDFSS